MITDSRYRIREEYCGYSVPMHVSRFCDEMIGVSRTRDKAEHVVATHNADRLQAIDVPTQGVN